MAENDNHKIQILPVDVVDRIAAGEVVQKPVSVVKEALENSLDAGATEVQIAIEGNGYKKIIISDNGCGISNVDLSLAVVRHATSKLRTVDDFATLSSFGFRGEALASISMVSHVTIHSRTQSSPVGYQMQYLDGKPHPTLKPKPLARQRGTTLTVQDLFYNLKHRQPRRGSSSSDEYSRILQVVQNYAILNASKGIGLVCEKRGGPRASTDLNTGSSKLVQQVRRVLAQPQDSSTQDKAVLQELQQRATKDVICLVYGSALKSQLQRFSCHWEKNEMELEGEEEASSLDCQGFISHPSYSGSKRTTLVLFVNNRLVECRSLQRRLEEIYGDFTKTKPFLFLSLDIPPDQVDVNVHPQKREVAMLNLDEVVAQLCINVRQTLAKFGQSFDTAEKVAAVDASKLEAKERSKKRKEVPDKTNSPADETGITGNESTLQESKESREPSTAFASTEEPAKKKKVDPSKLIRTNRSFQSGALEPFLSMTSQSQTLSNSTQSTQTQTTTGIKLQNDKSPTSAQHQPNCPLALGKDSTTADLSQPGAFATLASSCTCRRPPASQVDVTPTAKNAVCLPRQLLTRPRKVTPTKCTYSSIRALRDDVKQQVDVTVEEKLRGAVFVGVVTPYRSLLQAGEELILFHHYEAACALFYQLALARFAGGAVQAKLGQDEGIDIRAIIMDLLELQERLHGPNKQREGLEDCDLKVNETNVSIANQAAEFLLNHAEMLQEYFCIHIHMSKDQERILLSGLPVLLDNFSPCIHGLPLFLLRLATEVDWNEEKPCFRGICRELGCFYAGMPIDKEKLLPHVRSLFPALSSLLVPPQSLSRKGYFRKLTKISKLYRVFERC